MLVDWWMRRDHVTTLLLRPESPKDTTNCIVKMVTR